MLWRSGFSKVDLEPFLSCNVSYIWKFPEMELTRIRAIAYEGVHVGNPAWREAATSHKAHYLAPKVRKTLPSRLGCPFEGFQESKSVELFGALSH